MKLSRLVYEVVKATLKLGNTEFTYHAFREKQFDGTVDYSSDIDNSYIEINQAIQRLQDLKRIPLKIEQFKCGNDLVFDFKELNLNIKDIKNIVSIDKTTGDYTNIPYRNLGVEKVYLLDTSVRNKELFVEYEEDIPNFTSDDFDYSNYATDGTYEDIDLKDYGISESMAFKIIKYATARLFSKIDPQIAAREETLAEQYFTDLPTYATAFFQNKILKKYKVGD